MKTKPQPQVDYDRPQPCPFCGGRPMVESYRVACAHCGAYGPGGDGKAQAVRLWNTRAGQGPAGGV